MRLRNILLLGALCIAAVACGAQRSTGLSDSQAHAVATAMLDSIVESFNREDGAAYGANYWPDADLVGFDGSILDGRDAIIHNHVDMWAGPLKGAKLSGALRKVRVLGPEAVVVDVELTRMETPDTPPARIKFVLQKRDDAWRIASAQNTLASVAAP